MEPNPLTRFCQVSQSYTPGYHQNSVAVPADIAGQLYREAGAITGRTFEVTDFMKEKIERAGFVNVVEKTFKVPIGGWPADTRLREIGQWALLGFLSGLEGYALATLTRVLDCE